MSIGFSEEGRGLRLRSRPRGRSVVEQCFAFVRERKRATATVVSRDTFGNPSLRDQGLQIPGQCRSIVMVAAPEFRAAERSKLRDKHEQCELRSDDAERLQRFVVDCGQDSRDLPGSREQTGARDLPGHRITRCTVQVDSPARFVLHMQYLDKLSFCGAGVSSRWTYLSARTYPAGVEKQGFCMRAYPHAQ
jgi:hypothetical protein